MNWVMHSILTAFMEATSGANDATIQAASCRTSLVGEPNPSEVVKQIVRLFLGTNNSSIRKFLGRL